MTTRLAAGLVLLALAGAVTGAAAQAPIVNAIVERRTPAAGLAREIEAVAQRGTPAWIGYRVPMAARQSGPLTAAPTCCGRCRLVPPTDLLVLARVEQGEVIEVRPVPIDCDIDASGAALVWFDGVNPDDSVRWLHAMVEAMPAAPRRTWAAALATLAYHAAPGAVPALTAIARAHPDREVRRQAMVRLGQSRDPRAAEFLAQILLD